MNPLDPLSYASATPSESPGARPRNMSGDMIGGMPRMDADCGCHSGGPFKKKGAKVLLGIALVGAAAYAWRHR